MSDDANTTVATPAIIGWPQPPEVVVRNCVLVADSGPDAGRGAGAVADLAQCTRLTGRRLDGAVVLVARRDDQN